MSRTMRRLAQRLVVVGASTAVIAGAGLPLLADVASAATDTATAVTLSPHGAKDTVSACTPYTARVSPNDGLFDVQLSGTAETGGTGFVGFCDISSYSSTAFPNPVQPSSGFTVNPGTHSSSSDNTATDTDINGDTVYGCSDTAEVTGDTNNDPFTCDVQLQATNGVVSFGVEDDQYFDDSSTGYRTHLTGPVSMSITAFDDVNVNGVYESGIDTLLDSTTETWALDAASSISCSPTSQNADQDSSADYNCLPMTSSGTPYDGTESASAQGADTGAVRNVVASGPDKTESSLCSLAPIEDASGNWTVTSTGAEATQWECSVDNSFSDIPGTDSVTTYADNNDNNVLDNGEPSTSDSVTFVAPVLSGATITISCSANRGDTTTENCELPTSQPTATFVGKVVNSGGSAVGGALVTFWVDYGSTVGENGTFNPVSCITGSDGTCSTQYTVTDPTDQVGSGNNSPDYVNVGDTVNTDSGDVYSDSGLPGSNPDDFAFVEWHNAYPDEARSVTVTPGSGNQPSGGAQTLVATVTDRFGGPVKNACVGWTSTGAGHVTGVPSTDGVNYCVPEPDGAAEDLTFGANPYVYECLTDATGQCSVQVTSGPAETGPETVTADIANFTNEHNWYNTTAGEWQAAQECSLAANATYGDGYDYGEGFNNDEGTDEGSWASLSDLQDASVQADHNPYYIEEGADDDFDFTDGAFAIPNVTAGSCSASSTVTWQAPGTTNAASLSLSPAAATIHTNSSGRFTATVKNSSGAPVAGATVTFIQSGPGSFGGSSSATAVTDANGQASVVLTTGSARGHGTITASTGTVSGTSHYTVRQVMSASLHCHSPRAHVVKCVASVSPKISGLAVVFRVRSHGHWVKWGTRHTNSNGHATLTKKHRKSGKRYHVKAHVRATSTTTGANTNHSSVTAK